MGQAILIIVYIVGAAFEIAGLFLTAQSFLWDKGNGTAEWVAPEGWKKIRGPVLIAVGIVIGLIGNVASLYLGSAPNR
jgi:hypothetical protein